ncbi:hypothetical protein RJ639_018233 [Escallonia herrerae]|uniref:Uncharacterized protein n=1 Tax=Escallonia herrerae TaxID=1293975 RepID=A0AA88V7M7_9ASTE|nr:hypothetical protein RJ639_018233 [Escallonia herrerae]
MGVWDDLRSIAGRVTNWHVPDINVSRVPHITGLPSAATALGGIQVYKIVKEGFQDQPPTHPASKNQKSDPTLLVEEMQSQVEKLQEELNNIKQQNKIATHSRKASDPVKEELSAEPAKRSSPGSTGLQKVMIRSRVSKKLYIKYIGQCTTSPVKALCLDVAAMYKSTSSRRVEAAAGQGVK